MRLSRLMLGLALSTTLWSCQPEDDQKSVIVSRIKEASKLSTVEYVITKVVVGSQEKKFLRVISLNNSVFLANTEATLKLGVDLSKLRPDDVVVKDNMVSITLPPVEVINFSYPAEKFEVDEDFSQDTWYNSFTPQTIDQFYEQAELDIREKVNYLPLRSSAESKTRLFVEGLLRQAGYNEIFVQFDTTSTDLLVIPAGQIDDQR